MNATESDNTMPYLSKRLHRQATALTLLFAALPPLAGCGGGGTSAATTPAPSATTAIVTGQVQSSTGVGVSGDRVVLNLGSPRFAGTTTDAQGRFTLTVAAADITGSDAVTVLDSTGSLLATIPVVLTVGQSVTLPPIAIGPPPPPGSI